MGTWEFQDEFRFLIQFPDFLPHFENKRVNIGYFCCFVGNKIYSGVCQRSLTYISVFYFNPRISEKEQKMERKKKISKEDEINLKRIKSL